MEHPFFPTTTTRAEALRWLTIAEKLLSARDLLGSKSFATRARDSDPSLLPADQILAVADTLLAGDRRVANNSQDWYSVLQLAPHQGSDSELVATQYRRLAGLLNPQNNKFPLADQAFRLVVLAWSVLSNPDRKSLYDKEIGLQVQQTDSFSSGSNFIFFGSPGPGPVQGQAQVHHHSFVHGPVSSTIHFPQAPVQAQAHRSQQIDPLQSGLSGIQVTKQPATQGFMNFASGGNVLYGSGSVPGSGQEAPNKQPMQQNYEGFARNLSASVSEPIQEQPHSQSYTSFTDNPACESNLKENVGVEDEMEAEEERRDGEEEGERVDVPETFWTVCPYCYHMYEYPGVYIDCTLRCSNCKLAFQAVMVPSPPIIDGQDAYFCCLGFLPLAVSAEAMEKSKGAAASSSWTPFSPMFTSPEMGRGGNDGSQKGGDKKSSASRVYVDEDEVFVEVESGESDDDDDWVDDRQVTKKARNVKRKGVSSGITPKAKNVEANIGIVADEANESSKKGTGSNARKQSGRVAKNFGRLDLNVEFSNEVEEPVRRTNQGSGLGRGEDDNIEGIGFFEGLDEFLSSLPILNVVGDDKVVKAA